MVYSWAFTPRTVLSVLSAVQSIQVVYGATTIANTPLIVPHCAITAVINIAITFAIVLRILYFRNRITKVLGPTYGRVYTSFIMVVTESGAYYTITMVLCVLPFASGQMIGTRFENIVYFFMAQATVSGYTCPTSQQTYCIQGASANFMFFRISHTRTWTRDTVAASTNVSLQFTSQECISFSSSLSKLVPMEPSHTTTMSSRIYSLARQL